MMCFHRVSVVACVTGAIALPVAAAHAQGDRTANLFRESYALESARDYPGALARVREARAGGSAPYFATMRMGWLSYLHGDFTASIASYSEAIAAEPNAIEPKIGLTLPLLAQQNWRELERACTAVLASDPRNATGLARLGIAQYNSGNHGGAEATYRRLTGDYPSDLDYKTGLGWALLRQGKRTEARQWFAEVLAVSPDNTNARAGMTAR
jgi:tetratricopeptide (TPR) repeat protein